MPDCPYGVGMIAPDEDLQFHFCGSFEISGGVSVLENGPDGYANCLVTFGVLTI
jgi:hypothetical protein